VSICNLKLLAALAAVCMKLADHPTQHIHIAKLASHFAMSAVLTTPLVSSSFNLFGMGSNAIFL
jgi:hypothetical protein